MQKKELLKLPMMKVTEEMRKAAEETRTYSYWRNPNIIGPKYQKYYRAKKDRRCTRDCDIHMGQDCCRRE